MALGSDCCHVGSISFPGICSGSVDLVHQILSSRLEDSSFPIFPKVLVHSACEGLPIHKLLEGPPDDTAFAHIIAASKNEAGSRLYVLCAVGLRIDDEMIRVATGHLHLGVPLFNPYLCLQSGAPVNQPRTHGLTCIKSLGCHSRHGAINQVIQSSLCSTKISPI